MECRNCKDECESWCEDCRDNCDLCTCFKNYNRNQPERSKREDLPKWGLRAVMMPDGLCHFEDGTIIDSKQPIDEGCGALNIVETQ